MIINKSFNKKEFIVNPTYGNDEIVKLVAGIDAGSTETRICLINKEENSLLLSEDITDDIGKIMSEVYIIPSQFALISDEREILPKSESIEDNYDSHIILISNNAKNSYITRHRIIRGQKKNDTSGIVNLFMDSNTPKSKNSVFYLNILDSLGYSILQKYSGNLPKDVNISLVISVRPNELASIFKNEMICNLKGCFTFTWQNIKINLNILNLSFSTEPEAQITGSALMYDLLDYDEFSSKIGEPNNYIHIEGGGSSVGVEVVKLNHAGIPVILDSCSRMFALGGNYLMRITKDMIRNQKGINISDSNAYEALITGKIKNGIGYEDILFIIRETKRKVADDIFEKFKHEVLDANNDISLLDFSFITMAGRLFSSGECDVSIADYFSEHIKKLSINTEVIKLPFNYIPQGNLLKAMQTTTIFED